MDESVRGRAKRVLVVGASSDEHDFAPLAALAPDGLLIVIESDATRAATLRGTYLSDLPGSRCTVIGGDPRRILYKLAGPFDVIFCAAQHLAVRPMLQQLLSPDGVLITNGDT
jgi:protein-L-isoaspartate O-methyltransferase